MIGEMTSELVMLKVRRKQQQLIFQAFILVLKSALVEKIWIQLSLMLVQISRLP